ncbi:MAG: hypothetical protein QF535_04015, partial [Anaerolineales bacterium]|nr:hypothetical protein [Anaerolineales bacterium]
EHTLKLMGGGSLLSGGLDINKAASKLLLSSITVDSVSTSVGDSLGVVVENDSSISNFAVSKITPVSIVSGKTLEGSIGVTAGSIKLTETGSLASAVSMSGGTTLDADNSLTVSGALTHTGDITIDVAESRTLTYTGTPISLGEHTLKLMGGGSLLSGGLDINNAASKLLLSSITVDNVSTSVGDSLGVVVENDSTVTNLSMSQKLKLSVATTKTLIITDPLVIPSSGMELSGSGKLDLSDNLTMNGDVTLSSGSLILDATGLKLNLGGNLNLSGGTLLTDNNTYIHLLSNSVLTTDAEQIIANVTIEENTQPMLSMGSNTTILDVVERISIGIACPGSLPVKPKGQVRLSGGVQINTGGEFCIDGWLEGDIVFNGGTLRIDADTT